jgi:putative ABC transport system permease protein
MCFRNAAIKDTFREASRRLSRFFSIFAIVAIGVGFFVGIKATSPDMKLTADAYYKETNLMDIRLISPLGFEEEDVSAVLFTEGVESVMPSYSMDALMSIRGKNTVVKIHAIPKAYGSDAPLNVPALVSGRMPERSGECVIEENNVRNPFTFRLGDGIRLIPSSEDDVLSDKLKTDAFTIVGFVNSPEYISMERGVSTIGSGSVNCYILIPPEDFNFEVYTEIHASLAGTREISTFSEEYAAIAAKAKEKLTVLGEERGVIRYNHVKDEATEKISEGKTKLADAESEMEQKLSEAQAEIDSAKEKISTAEKDLADGEAKFKTEIADAEKQLADGYDKYYTAKAKYDKEYAAFQTTKKDAEAQIAAGERDLNQLGSEISQLQSVLNSMSFFDPQRIVVFGQLTMMQYQYSQGNAQLNQAKSDLAAGEQQLKDADKQLKSNKRKLDESKKDLEQAKIDTQKQIDDARIEIENAKLELADGEKKFSEKKAEAEQKINDARQDIADAEELLAELEVPEWIVLTREDNPGYSGYKENAERLDGVASLFPLFFLLVAGLVCLTTMMRMVEEQRGQIGIYKALGYGRTAIASKYFSYAMAAALFGSLLGILIGHILFPKVIYNAFDVLYTLPPLLIAMPWSIAAASAALAVASTAFAAVIATGSELRLMPASLMRPKAQKPGKWCLWKKFLPFGPG